MSFLRSKPRSAGVTASGTVRSVGLHGINSSAADEHYLHFADGVSHYSGAEKPGAMNMIRKRIGEVGKRPGYRYGGSVGSLDHIGGVFTYESPAETVYFFLSGDTLAVRQGEDGQITTKTLPEDFDGCTAAQTENHLFLMNGNCVFIYRISDGKTFYLDSEGNCSAAGETDPIQSGYVPTLLIGGGPDDATGETFEAVNLLNPYVAETYVADGTSLTYKVHLAVQPDTQVFAYQKNNAGGWTALTGFTVAGETVTFTAAPSAAQVAGEDNLKIVYRRQSFAADAYQLSSCTCGATFGVAGYKDRLFLSGNDSAPGVIYYSEMEQPLYFPDLNYLKVGGAETEVIALSGFDTQLSAICNDHIYSISAAVYEDETQAAFLPNALFTITGILQTPAPVKRIPPLVFDNETVYLTATGIVAVSPSGVMDERLCQVRSATVNRHLLQNTLRDCKMILHGDFLVLSDGAGRLFLLDAKQYVTSADQPFSYRQYDGYVWDGIPAKYMWRQGEKLYFSDGDKTYYFDRDFISDGDYRDQTAEETYSDICAYWETPDIYCNQFFVDKFFTRLGVLLSAETDSNGYPYNTDLRVYARFDREPWRLLRSYSGDFSVFRYAILMYSRFTYRNVPKSYAVYCRLPHKRGKNLKLRFENDISNESFTLRGYLIEYTIM